MNLNVSIVDGKYCCVLTGPGLPEKQPGIAEALERALLGMRMKPDRAAMDLDAFLRIKGLEPGPVICDCGERVATLAVFKGNEVWAMCPDCGERAFRC